MNKYAKPKSKIDEDGLRRWYNRHGLLHRLDGPASEWANGRKYWYFNGHYLGSDDEGFWALWDLLTDKLRNNTDLLYHLPGAR